MSSDNNGWFSRIVIIFKNWLVRYLEFSFRLLSTQTFWVTWLVDQFAAIFDLFHFFSFFEKRIVILWAGANCTELPLSSLLSFAPTDNTKVLLVICTLLCGCCVNHFLFALAFGKLSVSKGILFLFLATKLESIHQWIISEIVFMKWVPTFVESAGKHFSRCVASFVHVEGVSSCWVIL